MSIYRVYFDQLRKKRYRPFFEDVEAANQAEACEKILRKFYTGYAFSFYPFHRIAVKIDPEKKITGLQVGERIAVDREWIKKHPV